MKITGKACYDKDCPQTWVHYTAHNAIVEAKDATIARLEAERMRLRTKLSRLITSAVMLQRNAEGCAVNHYGEDFSIHGMPGWLADTQRDILAAEDELNPTPDPEDGIPSEASE
jgi:hypothetical protein